MFPEEETGEERWLERTRTYQCFQKKRLEKRGDWKEPLLTNVSRRRDWRREVIGKNPYLPMFPEEETGEERWLKRTRTYQCFQKKRLEKRGGWKEPLLTNVSRRRDWRREVIGKNPYLPMFPEEETGEERWLERTRTYQCFQKKRLEKRGVWKESLLTNVSRRRDWRREVIGKNPYLPMFLEEETGEERWLERTSTYQCFQKKRREKRGDWKEPLLTNVSRRRDWRREVIGKNPLLTEVIGKNPLLTNVSRRRDWRREVIGKNPLLTNVSRRRDGRREVIGKNPYLPMFPEEETGE